MKIAIITGPRSITPEDEQLVRAVVREIVNRGFQIYIGDAEGVDLIINDETMIHAVQWFSDEPRVFKPIPNLGRTPAGLAERSTRMVKETLRASKCTASSWSRESYEDDPRGETICIGFPNKPCPAGIVPARSWRTGEPEGSWTWSTLALCVGHDIETWIIPIGGHVLTLRDPGWCGRLDIFDTLHAWHFTPAPQLFEVQP